MAIAGLGAAPIWIPLVGAGVVAALFGLRTHSLIMEEVRIIQREHSQREEIDIELQQQRSAIDIFADGLDTAVFICEPKGDISYANHRATEIFNFPDPVGKTILAVSLSYDLQNLVSGSLEEGGKRNIELSFSYPTERVGLCEVWMEPTGRRVFLAIQDITELRRLERVRRDFVANVSHELRTPLASIRAMAETLAEEKGLPKLADKYLPNIMDEVDRLSLLTTDLLSLTSAESNPVRKQACDVAGIFRSAVIQLRHKAEVKKLDLSYQGPDAVLIEANSSQMSQVAINLVDNAINYTNIGAIAVSVKDEGKEVNITIQDTGIGIPSEHISRIFERFYRVDKARSRATGGTGLGLSIVKHIVEAHGGNVSVESALNQGSKFTLVLPKGDISGQ
jgi:two-component system phosphate regulon sensor histidine kinase PhoR